MSHHCSELNSSLVGATTQEHMTSSGISARKRYGGAGFALGYCGCKDAKSVSVVSSATASPSAAGSSTTTEARRKAHAGAANPSRTSTTTDTLTSASSSFVWEDAMAAEFGCDLNLESAATTTQLQSFSGLLRELSELEESVVSWGQRKSHGEKKLSTPPPQQEQRSTKVIKSGDLSTATGKDYRGGDGGVKVGLDGSVAVVKQSEDPLGDFRQSMLQMIVENGIVAGVDLREMLRGFLALNAPHHHDAILRAFAEICDAVLEASLDPVPVPVPARSGTRGLEPPRHRPPPSAWRL